MRDAVVLVHGIWSFGLDQPVLCRRLRSRGFDARIFRYNSLRRLPRDSAEVLQQYLQTIDVETLHIVAHSMGGVVALNLFDLYPDQRPGKIVMLSSPVAGSRVGRRVATWPVFGRLLLGETLEHWRDGEVPEWKGDRPLGMIAGTRGVGGGVLTGALDGVHDGMVAVDETIGPELTAHRTVPHSHFGMLQSRRVADLVAEFLRTGDFD